MKSGLISKTSPQVDVLEILTGSWDDYSENGFHITHTPFFTVLTATLTAGRHPIPFKFSVPVAGIVYHADGTLEAVIVRPGENAVSVREPGIFTLQVFGDQAALTRA